MDPSGRDTENNTARGLSDLWHRESYSASTPPSPQMERKLCILPGCFWTAQKALQRALFLSITLGDCKSLWMFWCGWVEPTEAEGACRFLPMLCVFHHVEVVWHTLLRKATRKLTSWSWRSLNRQLRLLRRHPGSCNNLISFWRHLPPYLIETQFMSFFLSLSSLHLLRSHLDFFFPSHLDIYFPLLFIQVLCCQREQDKDCKESYLP